VRFIFKFSYPPEKFNQAVLDGTAGEKIAEIVEETNPEAAYFFADGGRRGGLLVVNLEDTSEIPKIAEPWLLNFDAEIEFIPTMTADDLRRAGLDVIGNRWA
jgi:hypothetical protein